MKYPTPKTLLLEEGEHTVKLDLTFEKDGVNYTFKEWVDDGGNPVRVIDLNESTTIVGVYEVYEMTYQPAESPEGEAVVLEPTTLTLDPLTIGVAEGDTTTFTGNLSDNAGGIQGKTIHFWVDGADTGISAVTDADGNYTFNYTWSQSGTYNYRTRYLGD